MSLDLSAELQTYQTKLEFFRQRFAPGGVSPQEQQVLDLVQTKLDAIRRQRASVAKSSSSVASAPTATAQLRTVDGNGGYAYEQHADGTLFIVQSPINGSARTEVQPGTTGYDAIVAEIGPFPSSGSAPPADAPPTTAPDGSLPPSGGDTGGPSPGLPPGSVPASLEQLMAKDELTADEIAEARQLIDQQPADLQGALYEQLQEKTEYCNQRNNDSQESSTGGTCNLTAVAMALEYLGVKNPYPQMDFDVALVKIAEDNNYGAITTADCWTKVAAYLGVKNSTLFASSVKQGRDWWQTNVDNAYLKKGYGVVMSLDGHIVRLQSITDAGLVVDDPYGASKLSGRTFDDGRPKYSFTDSNDAGAADGAEAGNEGNDTGYPWADVEKYTFKYLMAFK